ncbi:MAG: peptidyl-prolyl cis-trans isomerase [Cypionkella sp.]|nr:peptidyl-prolyl cis-trans isomerase [Cypionkella sp.]
MSIYPWQRRICPRPCSRLNDADLQAEYDANIAVYTRPEAKRIQYVALLPDDVAKDLPADEAAIAALYQERIDQYIIPEKRLVERLVFPDAAAAAAARADLDAGKTFDDLVAARNLTLDDIDLGDVAKSDLGAAGDAVFALTEPGVVGPLDSDLGPALYRMNAILAAQETTLEQARTDLAREVAQVAARREIAQRVEAIDDALAGGATLEDLAQSEGLTLASTDYAKGADDNDQIAGYGAFAAAADALAQGDFPEAILLEDGGLVAMTLLETVPPTARPLAEVRDKVTAAWKAAALTRALQSLADEKLAAVKEGGDMASLGPVKTAKVTRDGTVDGAPAALIAAAFATSDTASAQIVSEGSFIAVMQLTAITPLAQSAKSDELRTQLETQLGQSLSGDILELYGRSVETAAGISLDQNVISSVHTQIGN